MVTQVKRAWRLLLAFVLACAMSLPATALALDGNGDTSEKSDGAVSVWVRSSDGGTEMQLKSYTAKEFEALATDVEAGYQYGNSTTVNVLAVKKLVEFDNLFADAGGADYWKAGASIEFTCTDGVYKKMVPTYEQLHQSGYFYPNRNNTNVTDETNPIEVPGGIAPSGWYKSQSSAGENSSDLLASLISQIGEGSGTAGTKVALGIMDDVSAKDGSKIDAGWRLVGNAVKITIIAPAGANIDLALRVSSHGEVVKDYTTAELKSLLSTDTQYYIQSNHGSVTSYAATDYITFDNLFENAGLSSVWKSGAYVRYICDDGPYGKAAPDYDTLKSWKYTYPNQSSSDMRNTTEAIEVPAVLALTYGKAAAEGITAKDAFAAAASSMTTYDNAKVFCGWTPDAEGAIEAPGWRMATGVMEVDLWPYEPASVTYSDVEAYEWYEDAVSAMSAKHLIKGYGDGGTFCPNQTLTRAEFAMILWRYADPTAAAASESNPTANTTGMPDVIDNEWYTGAANWAVANGVINGKDHGADGFFFAPNDTLTFQEMMKMIASYLDSAGRDSADPAVLSNFTDVDSIDSWAVQSLAWAYDKGFFKGYDDGTIGATENMQRCRAMQVLSNGFNNGLL